MASKTELVKVPGRRLGRIQTVVLPTKWSDKVQLWSQNCIKLADFLEKKPDSSHDQCSWAEPNSDAPCGTRACAMGWAAMSGLFEGLQYILKAEKRRTKNAASWDTDGVYLNALPSEQEADKLLVDYSSIDFCAAVNGKETSFDQAGYLYFGGDVTRSVFFHTSRSKKGTIAALRAWAAAYAIGVNPDQIGINFTDAVFD